ncbi:uncharacterized protein LOC132273862 isoform X2 [Cornus florida]|uniref:uncharacterized protein LOC132273862 isoform X2 n=1 Tax=Cornus florida TaxID=4283 RepID=UPI00289D8A00|nr:uncharacterized protein LOC132273862 isoform X2 [Cornus florida]
MGSTKKKRSKSSNETLDCGHSSSSPIFQNLLSAIKAPEGFKPPLLKGLYYLLVHLSSKPLKYGADSNYSEMEIDNCQIRVTFKDIEDFVASLRFLEPSDPCLPFLCTMLEVFADELLVHGRLREYLKLIDSVNSPNKMLYMCHNSHGNIGSVMEVISAHFSLSFSDEQAFENFLNRLFLLHGKDYRSSELSLTAAISMLLNPIMLSAPKFFQAHLISLVSEATGICMGFENMRPDLRLMDCYLSAFERSVILYMKHMSSLQMDSHPTGAGGCFVNSSIFGENIQPSFESYIQQVTRNKVNHIITKLDTSWHSDIYNMFSRTKSDLVTSSIAYMKDIQFVLDISYRDEILSILSFIILEALSGGTNDTALTTNGDTSPQDICFLASILKLMSSSLLQAIWCLRHSGSLGCPRTLKNFSSCKEYDSIVGIISCFQQFNICLPIQKSLYDMMESHPIRHKESMMMLLHFLGLLSLSSRYGLDFLVKGCILALMTLMNLFIFEEGNIETLQSLIASKSKSFSIGLPTDNVPEAVLDQRSSQLVASKFQRIQTLYLSAAPVAIDCAESEDGQTNTSANSSFANHMECVVGIEEETEETCNGEIFLNCILECPKKSSDIDDLTDFIECKQGKDYSGWLKDRQRYRKWKSEKMAVLRWQKKKKTWREMKGKRT